MRRAVRRRNVIIALLTDFGESDGFVGQMKGVLLQIAPHARLVDSSNGSPAGDVLRGALVLAMGNTVETSSATPSPDTQNLTTVTLALTPKQVDLLATADLNTTLRLALRPPKESIRAYPPESLMLGVPDRVQPAPAQAPAYAPTPQPPAAAPVVAAANKQRPAAPSTGIQVIELDRVSGRP